MKYEIYENKATELKHQRDLNIEKINEKIKLAEQKKETLNREYEELIKINQLDDIGNKFSSIKSIENEINELKHRANVIKNSTQEQLQLLVIELQEGFKNRLKDRDDELKPIEEEYNQLIKKLDKMFSEYWAIDDKYFTELAAINNVLEQNGKKTVSIIRKSLPKMTSIKR